MTAEQLSIFKIIFCTLIGMGFIIQGLLTLIKGDKETKTRLNLFFGKTIGRFITQFVGGPMMILGGILLILVGLGILD